MKLSKAQQEVVEKMREGAELRLSEIGKAYLMERHIRAINVRWQTFNSIRLNRVIERCGEYTNGYVYRLTEQYKNEQK